MKFQLTAIDPNFPTALRQTHPPVSILFGEGDKSLVGQMASRPGLAIVGSRQATPQGLADARWFAREASLAGLTVISGLAYGIDGAAHQGALEGKGNTIAVLGHGRDSVYPIAHHGLARQIAEKGGALVTEYPEGTPARPFHFPNRNRIIAALARAVLIVEAAPQSGSLSTAHHALELGIDVFVVPGSIHQPQSLGSNHLIRHGAQLVQSPRQLLEDLGVYPISPRPSSRQRFRASAAKTGPSEPLSAVGPSPQEGQTSLQAEMDSETQGVLRALSFQAITVAELQTLCGLERDRLYGCLLVLELSSLVNRTPDGRWLKYKPK